MSRTHTHICATLDVSPLAYDEIRGKLLGAGYDHAIVDDTIDMHGIGLRRETSGAPAAEEAADVRELRERITWQQTRALIRIANHEATAGDVALCRELARAILPAGETPSDAATGVAKAAVELLQEARATLALPKGAKLSDAIQLLAEFMTALAPRVTQHENDSVRWSAQELHDGILALRATSGGASS